MINQFGLAFQLNWILPYISLILFLNVTLSASYFASYLRKYISYFSNFWKNRDIFSKLPNTRYMFQISKICNFVSKIIKILGISSKIVILNMALLGVKISKLARRSCFLLKEHSLAEHVSFLIEFGTKSEIKKHLFGRRVMFWTKIWNNHSGKHLDPSAHSRFLVWDFP